MTTNNNKNNTHRLMRSITLLVRGVASYGGDPPSVVSPRAGAAVLNGLREGELDVLQNSQWMFLPAVKPSGLRKVGVLLVVLVWGGLV